MSKFLKIKILSKLEIAARDAKDYKNVSHNLISLLILILSKVILCL